MKSTNALTAERTVGPMLLVAALIVVLGGCGGSGDSPETSGDGNSETSDDSNIAAEVVQVSKESLANQLDARLPTPVGEPFDASAAAGETVTVVELTASNPAIAEVSRSLMSSLEHVGVNIQRCDGRGVSVNISSCIRQGVSQEVAAIVVVGGDPKAYAEGTSDAEEAGIPVTSALDLPLPSGVEKSGVDATEVLKEVARVSSVAAPPAALSGTLAADFIIADSNGDAEILFITSPGIVQADYVHKAFLVRMEACTGCNVTTEGVAITSWASDLAAVVTSKLAQNPDINYVMPVFDPMAAYTNPAIRQAGKADSVNVVTINGSLQQVQELSQGGVIAADIGQNLPELGFIAADQALRFIVGAPEVKEAAAAVRVFVEDNIDSIDVNPDSFHSGEWYTGSADALTDIYYELWSVQK